MNIEPGKASGVLIGTGCSRSATRERLNLRDPANLHEDFFIASIVPDCFNSPPIFIENGNVMHEDAIEYLTRCDKVLGRLIR
ncbi:MAG TPA: hypothetical protein VLU94_02130, partial [Candidatus Nitrosotalea sp.]|nr:hypothetical protein [Candidatus Nitrosotalea sp.]